MNFTRKTFGFTGNILVGCAFVAAGTAAFGQVSPTEVSNPRAKADEQKYLPQLVSLQKAIGGADFPFTFRLARYLDAKPGQRAALDSNGIEFVSFQERVVLKVSGFYRVAFNSMQVTQSGRASQTMLDAILPILRIVTEQIPQNYDYDAIGFEILYDARDSGRSYDYEGHEVLTVVFGRDDAFALASATTDTARQEILDRSDIFVNGKQFELALGDREPMNVPAHERPAVQPSLERTSLKSVKPSRAAESAATAEPAMPSGDSPAADADAAGMQRKLQSEVSAIRDGQGAAVQHPDNIPPSFETKGEQKMLHYTMQNTLSFERNQTSIYKRAAQSFDLFLAPELKDISKSIPTDAAVDALHFSVLNRLGADKNETIEFICPMDSMRSFVEDKITSQDLVNKSKVLVNGVRIGLDLQLVE